MNYYVIRRTAVADNESNQAAARAGVGWLADVGGGTVLVSEWGSFEDTFGRSREDYTKLLSRSNIRFEKLTRHVRGTGNVLVVHPDRTDLEIVDRRWADGDVMVVEWDPGATLWWRGQHEVCELEPPAP